MRIQIGNTIKVLRKRDKRTQEDVAEALGITFQAVSRWESEIAYPDIELIPSIANYFGITIDELFGYQSELENRINNIVSDIRQKNEANNGQDICIEECLQEARNALAEYPSNTKIMLCLSDILYNAGFARHGEYHRIDSNGYDVRDTELHRTYAEWQEAIKLYETLIPQMEEGKGRDLALKNLIALYSEIGENEKAAQKAGGFSDLHNCRELAIAYAYEGKKRAELLSSALLDLVALCSEQMVQAYMSRRFTISPTEAVDLIKNAISIFDLVCTDGQYGRYNGRIACLYLYLSTLQWICGDHDGAFVSLDLAYEYDSKLRDFNGNNEAAFKSPLLCDVKINPDGRDDLCQVKRLPEIFPYYCLPGYDPAMKEDPRFGAWVKKCNG